MIRSRIAPTFLLASCALLLVACSPDPTPATDAQEQSSPRTATGTTNASAQGLVEYRCKDGSLLQVRYGADSAEVTLRDGSRVHLRKAESASKGPGSVYVGDTRSLFRNADHVQWQGPAGEPLTCSAS